MPLLDDLKDATSDEELERRKFLGMVGAGALVIAGTGTAVAAVEFLDPVVFYEEQSRFRVVRPEEMQVGDVIVLRRQGAYVVRGEEGYYAMSATCTHLGCRTNFQADAEQIFCPCHGSRFDLHGTVTDGPAPRPLPRLELTLDQGFLVVDVRRQVPADTILRV